MLIGSTRKDLMSNKSPYIVTLNFHVDEIDIVSVLPIFFIRLTNYNLHEQIRTIRHKKTSNNEVLITAQLQLQVHQNSILYSGSAYVF